jgi:hypothetical protein
MLHEREFRRDLAMGFGPSPRLPIGIGQEMRGLASSRRTLWFWRIAFFATLALVVSLLWPEPVVRAEISYVGLQQEALAGRIDTITIHGEEAWGTFTEHRWARSGEISVVGQEMPGSPQDEVYRANAFTATIPEDTLESFVAMAERQGAEVKVIPLDS